MIEPIEIGEGHTFLIIVRGERVVDYTWAIMPYIEFVERSMGKLPEDAWVGTISKINGELAVISSKTFLRCADACPRVGRENRESRIQVMATSD